MLSSALRQTPSVSPTRREYKGGKGDGQEDEHHNLDPRRIGPVRQPVGVTLGDERSVQPTYSHRSATVSKEKKRGCCDAHEGHRDKHGQRRQQRLRSRNTGCFSRGSSSRGVHDE